MRQVSGALLAGGSLSVAGQFHQVGVEGIQLAVAWESAVASGQGLLGFLLAASEFGSSNTAIRFSERNKNKSVLCLQNLIETHIYRLIDSPPIKQYYQVSQDNQ